MPTVETKTIKPGGGGDYSSLSAWEAAERGNLVSQDKIKIAECYSGGDLGAVAFSGWTTDATRYIEITVPLSERHQGTYSTSKAYCTSGSAITINSTIDIFIRIRGLQIDNTWSNAGAYAVRFSNNGSGRKIIDSCLIRKSGATNVGCIFFTNGTGNLIKNCIILQQAGGSTTACVGVSGGSIKIYYSTIVNLVTNAFCLSVNSPATITEDNNFLGETGTGTIYQGTATYTKGTHTATTDAAATTAGLRNIAFSTSNFTNVSAGSENLKLVLGSALLGQATDLSGGSGEEAITTDFQGVPRDTIWDIGAHQFARRAAPLPVTVRRENDLPRYLGRGSAQFSKPLVIQPVTRPGAGRFVAPPRNDLLKRLRRGSVSIRGPLRISIGPEPVDWTEPDQGSHPRIWLNASTLGDFQARIAGGHRAHWGELQRHCRLVAEPAAYPNSYFEGKEPEEVAVLAFSYLLEPEDPRHVDYADRAVEIALHLANLPLEAGQVGQYRLFAMSLVYDWAYPRLSLSDRRILRARIALYVDSFRTANAEERLWGVSLPNCAAALVGLAAILADGSLAENALWRTWTDGLFAVFDLGPYVSTTFFSALRFFGEADGGTHRGAGPFGYDTELEEICGRLLPAVESALGVPWQSDEAWWDGLAHWKLWHWRGDRTFHRQGDHAAPAAYSRNTQLHLLQTASRQDNDFGKACMWLVEEIQNRAGLLGGAQELWNVLFRDVTRPAVRPTVAGYGAGAELRRFTRSGKLCLRDGWEEAGTSVTIEVPEYFVGGHARRRAGHFNLAAQGLPLLYEKGHFDPAQDLTPKETGNPDETGHRYTYAQRIPAANVLRIFDTDEPTDNLLESFQRTVFAADRYGVLSGGSVAISNDGGQLVPKNTDSDRHQPADLEDLLAEPKWLSPSWLFSPAEGAKYCHAVFDLAPFYYSAKCTSYRRHFLWVKRGAIPGWPYPVLLVFDQPVVVVDGTAGKLTQVLQLQAAAGAAAGTAAAFRLDRSPGRLFVKVLSPATVEKTEVADYEIAGEAYAATAVQAFDDPAGVRIEINASTSSATHEFLTVLFPCPIATAAAPAVSLVSDATYIGATIGGIECKMTRADPFAAIVGSSSDVTAPAAPTGLSATALVGAVDLDWSDNGEGDLDHYSVYRSTGGPYTLLEASVVGSSYRDRAVVLGTAYSYKVTAVDTSGNESAQSSSAGPVTPDLGISGPPVRPPDRSRRRAIHERRRRVSPRYPYR